MSLGDVADLREPQSIGRLNGLYRSNVVETNDPLQMHRIRIKCPELHDFDLKPEDCPWALVSSALGGSRAGSWNSPVIGDQVWVMFEKGHPYGPVVIGFADATRRMRYPLASVSGPTPLPVDENGAASEHPDDFVPDYLPADGRPMTWGRQDRYGNLDVSSAIGYYPEAHKSPPPSADYDAIQHAEFSQPTAQPEIDKPDVKYMLRLSKYGHALIMGDQGYHWHKSEDMGEFVGDPEKDSKFEMERWKYLLKLHNEDKASGRDQRRIGMLTRYGHKFEMRDVGWAQLGPQKSKSRDGEYGKPAYLSEESKRDERWIKVRTKAGMLFQMCDAGSHPQDDVFVKRKLLDEVGDKSDHEDEWKGRDARWIRLISRHGYKFVIDDRGSDPKDAEGKESPQGNGILIKGRRTASSQGKVKEGDPRGFYWEFNENDLTNQTTWGSPAGLTAQINDRQQYIMLASRKSSYPRPWKKLSENEFLLEPLVAGNLENSSHHLKIDHQNEYLRLKTRGAKGEKPIGQDEAGLPLNPTTKLDEEFKDTEYVPLCQGLEIRDGSKGDDPWVELVDANGRNLFLWGKGGILSCSAKRIPTRVQLLWWMDENKKEIVIRHNEDSGKIQIFSNAPIEVISKAEINMHSTKKLTLRSDEEIVFTAGGGSCKIAWDGVSCLPKVITPSVVQFFPTIEPLPEPTVSDEPQLEPSNRGERHNLADDSPAPETEITHPV